MKKDKTIPDSNSKASSGTWYKKWWGIVAILLFWPFLLIWYTWAKSKWSTKGKVVVTSVVGLIILIASLTAPSASSRRTNQGSNQSHTATVQENTATAQPSQPPKPNFVYDVPSLVGMNIDQVRQTIGRPLDKYLEPTSDQAKLGVTEWDNSWSKNNVDLLVTYNTVSRVITDFFISSDDSTNKIENEPHLLELGNLSQSSSAYKIDFVKDLKDQNIITGVKAIPD